MAPLVSILIPAYNAGPWIGEAIESALAQTWPHTEVIVVDDGSRDDTLAVAKCFASDRVRILSHANCGASRTRNRALESARGDYIQWLDADDVLTPEKVAMQMRRVGAAGPRVLLSSEWARFYYRSDRVAYEAGPLWADLAPAEWIQTKMESNTYMAIESWLVSRELAERAGPWDAQLSADDDGDYFARVVAASERVCFVPGARSLCRLANPHSLSAARRSQRWLNSQFQSIAQQVATLRALEDSPRSRAAALAVLQRCFICFYPECPELVGRARRLAAELGGSLEDPHLSWKYGWIRRLFGWGAAKRAQAGLPSLRAWRDRNWDRLLHSVGL